ncbi:hypothetical protein WEV46_004607 [Salmonella enterica]
MDLLSGVTLFRQAFDLLKLIQETRDKKRIDEAVGELRQKITELQMLNSELSNSLQASLTVNRELTEKINKLDDFAAKSKLYIPYATAGGSWVYTLDAVENSKEPRLYVCPHCYEDHVISFLQPNTNISFNGGYFIHYCPRCRNEYFTDEVPPIQIPWD